MKPLLAVVLFATLAGCSSGGADATACTSFCTHSQNCSGASPAGCGDSCSNPAAYNPSAGICSNYAALFNCLAAVSCDELLDAGTPDGSVVACSIQGDCH